MPYELLEDESENAAITVGKEGLRHGARTLSNVATRAVGLPGDIFSLVNQFIAKPISKGITGEEGVSYEETALGKILPTTETHRKGLESKTGEYLKPQNKIEKFADDVIEDTALLLNPSQLIAKGAKRAPKLMKTFFKSLGANVAGESVKQIAGSETAGDITKLGSLFFLSVLDQPAAAKQVSNLYKEAESKIPANAKTNARNLSRNLDNLEKTITKQRPRENLSPAEKFVVDQTDKVKNLIKNYEIPVDQAIAQKRSLNQELSTLYKEVPKLGDQKRVRGLAKQINSYLNQALKQYGDSNPQFYKPYKEADQAFGTLARSNFISHWVDKNVLHSPATAGLLHLFGPVAKVSAKALIPYQAAKLGYRIAKSPTLAKIYGNALKAAAKEDAKTFNKYLKELDQNLQSEENKDQFEFID